MALNDVSFELGPGVYGLLGPNGAGKSSLLKMASGQLRPSQGTVELLGRPAFGSPEVFHAVGLCSDTDAMFEDFTGLQFVSSLLSLNGFDRAQALNATGPSRSSIPGTPCTDGWAVTRDAPEDCWPRPSPTARGALPR
jgi:ABC-2 type transport system ATP-binding protein